MYNIGEFYFLHGPILLYTVHRTPYTLCSGERSRSISRVLYPFGRLSLISRVRTLYTIHRTPCCHALLSLPTLRLTRAALKRRFTWNCSPQYARFTSLVSVAVTKHCCLTAVNRYGALCCPDFPLPTNAGSDKPTCSRFRQIGWCVSV